MTSLIITATFFGAFCFYSTSKKNAASNVTLENWLCNHTLYSKLIGILCLSIALFFNISIFGLTGGILFELSILMAILSLLVLIKPLQIINYKLFFLFILISIITEFIF